MQPILDVGEKIGGARKDIAAALRNHDLDGLTDTEKSQLVTKDVAWPKPDWAALVADGMSPTCAALLKIMRDRIPAHPVLDRGDFTRACKGYLKAMETLGQLAAICQTTADAGMLHQVFPAQLRAEMGYQNAGVAMETINAYGKAPYRFMSTDKNRATLMVAEGFPEDVPAWRKGLRAIIDKEGMWRLRDRKGWLDMMPQASQDAAWAVAQKRYDVAQEARKAARAGMAEIPARPHLRDVVRQGMHVRPAGRIDAEDFMGAFGFRGVEFGEWLPQDERQTVLNYAWDALHDLSVVSGLELRQISLGGTLALAFGARGSGGAAAHYEPGRKVVNLTRMSGAGSLGHEWGHAFDHWLGSQGGPSMEGGQPRFASGYRTQRDSRLAALSGLPPDCAGAADRLMRSMWRKTIPIQESLQPVLEQRALVEETLRNISPMSAQATQARARLHTLKLREQVLRENPVVKSTSYYEQAVQLSGRNGYHARPTEMWARSFECMIADALDSAGMRSEYLVQGVEEDRFAGAKWRGNPYPVGQERKKFNLLHTQTLLHARSLIPEPPAFITPKAFG